MQTFTRRRFLACLGGVGLTALGGVGTRGWAQSGIKGRVVVIGGGFGGATCARYVRQFDPTIAVTLVERSEKFVTCPFSNAVLGDVVTMNTITQHYDTLRRKHGVEVIHDEVIEIDAEVRRVTLKSGKSLQYDRLVVAPGIAFRWDAIDGYDAKAAQTVPHAWKGGGQTVLLSQQLRTMQDGGLVILCPPANPFRCPPGPYERASLIAHYLQRQKPKSKILILDAKEKFSKQGLFQQGWEKLYPGMIEWVAGTAGGIVKEVDAKSRTAVTELGERHRADVLNVIPPQQANLIAQRAGLTDKTGWCPVDQRTFASQLLKHIHVIGDSAVAGALPKSGFAANSEAKVCAASIVSELNGREMPEPSYVNTCYSLVGPEYGISVAMVYRLQDGKIAKVDGAGGVSPEDADAEFRKQEAQYARGWYDSIARDSWG